MPCLKLPIEYFYSQTPYRGFFEEAEKCLYSDFCTVTEDDIGNLKTENRNGNVFKYTANSVNQYTERTVPSRINISGSADASAKVTIKQTSAGYTRPTRYGNYFNAFFNLDNSSNSVSDRFDIYAVKYDGTKDIVAKQTLNVFVPKTPEQFTYDNDGNLLTDGKFTYTWNGENRLVSAIETDKQKIDFIYDYMGRRINKKVYSWTGSWTLGFERRFVYDGWNLIAEYDGSNNLLKSYLWGDALLAVTDGANAYLPVYDGNRNIMSYLNATDASLVASYEYDPNGRILWQYGNQNAEMSYRFSSEYYDKETGMYYYGYRYYNPGLCRWLNRDPIEEQGGNNLYAFVNNDAMNHWDYLGLKDETITVYVQAKNLDYSSAYNLYKSLTSGVGHSWIKLEAPDTKTIEYWGHSGEYGTKSEPTYAKRIENNILWWYKYRNTDEAKAFEPVSALWHEFNDGQAIRDKWQTVLGKRHSITRAVRFCVSDKELQNAKNYINSYNFRKYGLTQNNCTSFAANVMMQANIDTEIVNKVKVKVSIPEMISFKDWGNMKLRNANSPYSVLIFATPDLMNSELERLVNEGKGTDVTQEEIRGASNTGRGKK